MNDTPAFGQWLKQHRQALDLTQEELAAQVGCSVETIRKLERGQRRPSREIARRMAAVLIADPDARPRFIDLARGRSPDAAEPPTVAPSPGRPRHNLPAHLTSFIGREREVAEVRERLGTSRLLTLTGVGGTGKTRLALEVAATLHDRFPAGLWFIELAPLADPALVPQTVTGVIGLREEPGRPLLATLMAALNAGPVLLLLDNCEHLITACAELADTLLHACPHLQILATSREALRILGETIYLVPTLATPDPQHLPSLDGLQRIGSVRLFVERAHAVQQEFALTDENAASIAAICRQLDGLPLALELAAARVRSLPTAELAARLNQCFRLLSDGNRTALPRQQTLQGLIDWSYDLLTPDEQRLFRLLSVFAGGWSLEAAEAICAGHGLDTDDLLDLLTHLVDKSLVVIEAEEGRARYTMHETLRQYAWERLTESGESETLQQRHAQYYLALAEHAERQVRGPVQGVWLDRLEQEHDNLRAALCWALDARAVAMALRLCVTLTPFWRTHAHTKEGRDWLNRALTLIDTGEPSVLRAQAVYHLGWLAYDQDDWATAETCWEDSLTVSRSLGDTDGITRTLWSLGGHAWRRGDHDAAGAFLEQSLTLARELGDTPMIATCLMTLANVAVSQGEAERSVAVYEAALALERQLGDAAGTSRVLLNLGEVVRLQGHFERAEACYEESRDLRRALGDYIGRACAVSNLGYLALQQGDYQRAEALLTESCTTLAREVGYSGWLAACFVGLAEVAVIRRLPIRAARLFGAAERMFETMGNYLSLVDRAGYEHHLELTRAQLSEAAFAAAWIEGRSMTREQAVAYALEDAPRPPGDSSNG